MDKFNLEAKIMEQIEQVDPLDDKAFKILLSDDQCFKLIAESRFQGIVS